MEAPIKSMIYYVIRDDMHFVYFVYLSAQSSLNQALSFTFCLKTLEEKRLSINEVPF